MELLFQEGLIHRERQDPATARACWLRLLETRDGPHFASVDTGLRGYKAHHNLATLFREQGQVAEAETHWRAALAGMPRFVPAAAGLGDLYLEQGRYPELDDVLRGLDAGTGPATAEATLLRARAHLARAEFAAARNVLEAAIERRPAEPRLRLILSQA